MKELDDYRLDEKEILNTFNLVFKKIGIKITKVVIDSLENIIWMKFKIKWYTNINGIMHIGFNMNLQFYSYVNVEK